MRNPVPADAPLSAERMRAAFSSPAGGAALLQRRVPASGTAMVALEGSAKLSDDGGGQRQTQRAEPALSRARQKAQTTSAGRSRCRGCEG